jgi:hypothetical protein
MPGERATIKHCLVLAFLPDVTFRGRDAYLSLCRLVC